MSNAEPHPAFPVRPEEHSVIAGHSGLPWHRSSHSGGANNCVEAAGSPPVIHVRDSKTLPGPMLSVASAAWCVFLGTMRTGASGG